MTVVKLASAAMLSFGLLIPSLPALAQSADAGLTDAQREAVRAEIRALLKAEPEIVLEALQDLEEQRRQEEENAAQAALENQADALYADGFSFVGGNPDGDITLVEFLDYRCGFCKRAHDEVTSFLAADGNVRLVVKEFPVLGPDSEKAGQAAMAAMKQDGGAHYKKFHDAMITHRGALTEPVILQLALQSGLDVAQLKNDMTGQDVIENIGKTYQLAEALQIRGTPAFVMGSQIIRGYVPADALAQIAAAARAEQAAQN